eukprot:TRINITY_DN7473_c0_g1_i1.p1 TRINITY_DN7473_c0_g1~~TRINITY_DN7473_c0_g1_i1.p1  ORF type:complete len:294 (+),score=90.06 TRINITY_DN7473_c0_g1_i1:58-939(+)
MIWKLPLILAALQPVCLGLALEARNEGGRQQRAFSLRAAAIHRKHNFSLSILREPKSDEEAHEEMRQKSEKGETYEQHAARIENRCVGTPKCQALCVWIKRALLKKYGSLDSAYKAGDGDGDDKVSDEEFIDQAVDAGVDDDAISARGYIFLYIIDTNLDGFASKSGYERVFRIAGVQDSKLSKGEKKEIKDSDGWGSVKDEEDFKPGTTTEKPKKEKEETRETATTTTEEENTSDGASWFKITTPEHFGEKTTASAEKTTTAKPKREESAAYYAKSALPVTLAWVVMWFCQL